MKGVLLEIRFGPNDKVVATQNATCCCDDEAHLGLGAQVEKGERGVVQKEFNCECHGRRVLVDFTVGEQRKKIVVRPEQISHLPS